VNKKTVLYLLSAILLIYGIIDYINYNKNNYDVTGFIFICNNNMCEIRHKKASGEIKYTEKIDINNIAEFSTKLEKIPRNGGEGLVIYANCKDGTSFRFSPIYVRPSRYVDKELINPLNEAIRRRPLSINIRFPR